LGITAELRDLDSMRRKAKGTDMIMSKEKRPPTASPPKRGSVIIIDHDIEQSRRLADYLSQEGFEASVEQS
jgi:PleD family two-component response regulator